MNGPCLNFYGADSARQISRVFTENLHDMLCKVDDGAGQFPKGFFHTSTVPHEGVHYYNDMWTRDGGRGLIELARLGFVQEAVKVAEYLLGNINHGDHWGRTTGRSDPKNFETDGNALLMTAVYNVWKSDGMKVPVAKRFIDGVLPVVYWAKGYFEKCPYGYLMPCESEMTGNPNTPYQVYGIYPNYAMAVAFEGLCRMARTAGKEHEASMIEEMKNKLEESIFDVLASEGRKRSLTPEGCWINGIDGRDGRPYEFSEWDGTSWPVYHWTRQLPFILLSDLGLLHLKNDRYYETHRKSYEYVNNFMSSNKYYRKYGFVSNTGWTGTGGRHDDTMCGYGQGFMTQAALLLDDVNVYSNLIKGISLLSYDGDIVKPMAFDMNPWVMHECFNFENYEEGYDHTFGVVAGGRPGVNDKLGDEGNLVQEAEIIKAIVIAAGIGYRNDGGLSIIPRIPWNWEEAEVIDFPYVDNSGNLARISFRMVHDRSRRKTSFTMDSTSHLEDVGIRLGPYPAHLRLFTSTNMEIEKSKGASWIWLRGLSGKKIEKVISLW